MAKKGTEATGKILEEIRSNPGIFTEEGSLTKVLRKASPEPLVEAVGAGKKKLGGKERISFRSARDGRLLVDRPEIDVPSLRFTLTDEKAIATESACHRYEINRTRFDHRDRDDAPWISTSTGWIDLADLYNEQGSTNQALACIEIARCFSELGERCKNAAQALKNSTGMAVYEFCDALEKNKKINIIGRAIADNAEAGRKALDKLFMHPDQYISECKEALKVAAKKIGDTALRFLFDQETLADQMIDIADRAATMSGDDWAHFIASKATAFARDPALAATGIMGMPSMQAASLAEGFFRSIELQAAQAGRYAINEKYSPFLTPIAAVFKKAGEEIAGIAENVKATPTGATAVAGAGKKASSGAAKKIVTPKRKTPPAPKKGTGKPLPPTPPAPTPPSALASKSGTVWDNIKTTGEMYPHTKIPKSFEITAGKERLWVHPNATEHMWEYITKAKDMSHSMPINSQTLLKSFQASVEKAVSKGIPYDTLTKVGPWELKIGSPRKKGLLPAIIHALYTPAKS